MRALIVARKPLSERNIALNTLKHGTGALNIDASRIGTQGGTESTGDPNLKNKVYGKGMGGLGIVDGDKGRWPANLILEHQHGCEIVGQESVEGRTLSRWDDGMKPWGEGAGHPLTATYTGDETVDIWACQPECPVLDLGAQSGESTSREGAQTERKGGKATNFAMSTSGQTHSDKGTAARFFKQVKWVCDPECPVQDLGGQSGDREVSGAARKGCSTAKNSSGMFLSGGGEGQLHNDQGTAARYFKQIKP